MSFTYHIKFPGAVNASQRLSAKQDVAIGRNDIKTYIPTSSGIPVDDGNSASPSCGIAWKAPLAT